MPVSTFLDDFLVKDPPPRPQGPFAFSKVSVSQNEDEFVGVPDSIDVQ